jgi:dipeptidyl aminopeptidase/acylaminoacyl peptidase
MNDAMGSCVEHNVGIGVTYTVTFFDSAFHEVAHGGGTGIPSRTRLSPSGRLAAVTSFTQGDSYLQAGQFSTTTSIFDTHTGRAVVANLERLHVFRGGRAFDPLDRNFWGVTFASDSVFYATMASGNTTWLVRGDLRTRTMRTVHENVECPSLSPDGARIAFKRRVASGAWRFTVLDLSTGAETPLAEHESVDDQLAWLDGSKLAYGWQGAVWVVDADGGGRPRLLLRNAQSPTVVDPGLRST